MAPVSVRLLAAADLQRVVRIDAVQTGQPKPAYWKQLFLDFVGRRTGRGRIALAADARGRLAGFVFGDIRAFEFGSEPCGWILEIGVDPAHARQGIASALLAEACRRLRAAGVGTVRTMVRRNNVPMLTFFRTNGFAGGPYVQLELTPDMDVE
jgi:ribosomal protein S18 acetylase RimI-like enzyme